MPNKKNEDNSGFNSILSGLGLAAAGATAGYLLFKAFESNDEESGSASRHSNASFSTSCGPEVSSQSSYRQPDHGNRWVNYIYEKTSEEKCSICLGIFNNEDKCTRLQCMLHVFHTNCIKKWFDQNEGPKSCPVCRRHI